MEFYYEDTPATGLFRDHSVVLKGDRTQDEVTQEWTFTERILYMNYEFGSKSISFAIYDDEASEYFLDTVYVEDYVTAENLLKKITAEHPGRIDTEDYLPLWKVFFEAMKETMFIESPVTNVSGSCGTCGDYNRNEFIFLYVPAVPGTALEDPSLGLHWEFGCFGGEKIAGDYEEVYSKVSDLLIMMKSRALDEYKKDVVEAMAVMTKAGKLG